MSIDITVENGFYADTLRLRQHSIGLQEQKRIAQLLYEQLRMAQGVCGPADVPVYGGLMEQAQKLVHYFDEMSKTVEDMGNQLEQLSLKIRTLLRENRPVQR